jgi:hypothetical protein
VPAVVAFAVCLLAASALAADPEPASPTTRLYEVSESGKLHPLQRVQDWKLVPEDTLTHRFAGCAVVVNDKLALMVGTKNVSVYALGAAKPEYRADIQIDVGSRLASSGLTRNGAIRIVENSAAAVTLETAWKVKDGAAAGTVSYRLTAGQPIIEVRPGEHVPHVVVAQFGLFCVVVPDFFGDDMLFSYPSNVERALRWVDLPTENCFLTLTSTAAAGDGMMMCVWPSNRQQLANFGDSNSVQCVAGKTIWLAFLNAAGIWHAQKSDNRSAGDWKPPFSAKWRADLVGEGTPQSWAFDGQASSPPAPLPQGERGGIAPTALPQGERGGMVPAAVPQAKRGVVVYPIDRDRQTPLDVFTPMDVLRNTLGVGPCQYILQTEGLGSENNPTPDNVMNWVEKQFTHKKQKKSADEIREMLAQMGVQVVATQARIDRYAAFARELRKLVGEKELMPNGATGMMSLRDTLAYMDRSLAEDGGVKAVERVQQLKNEVIALIDKADAAAECGKLGGEARRIGLIQQRTLARCRMAVRWVRTLSKMAAAETSSSELAKSIQTRTEEILYAK